MIYFLQYGGFPNHLHEIWNEIGNKMRAYSESGFKHCFVGKWAVRGPVLSTHCRVGITFGLQTKVLTQGSQSIHYDFGICRTLLEIRGPRSPTIASILEIEEGDQETPRAVDQTQFITKTLNSTLKNTTIVIAQILVIER